MSATVFYEHGSELATLTNEFKVDGTLTDPTTVTLTVTTPAGVATPYTWAGGTVTRTSTGIFTKDIACSEAGTWLYLWVGTGVASDAVAGTWTVHPTALNKLYCTPAELKARVGIDDTLDDDQILVACEAVSRWIDGYCERRFYRATETRTYTPSGSYGLDVDDLVSVTTLKTDADGDGVYETTWATSDYQLLPVNPGAAPETRPYTAIKAIGSLTFPAAWSGYGRGNSIELVGVFGWPAVPDPVKTAAAILVADFLKLGSMTFGVQGYGDYGAIRARMSGPATQLLDRYRKHPVLIA